MPVSNGEIDPLLCVGIAVMLSGSLTLVWMLKSKSTPIRSKNVSARVMNRTSIVTCRSCSRRSCLSRFSISSCTSCVWLTTRLRLVSNWRTAPGPPWASHVVGCTVLVIRSISGWKLARLPPGWGGPNGIDGVEPVTGGPPPPSWAARRPWPAPPE